jgi:hypothetical protein
MGWMFKGLLVLLALVFFGAGVWWVSGIIFVYLFFSWRSGRRRVQRTIVVAPQGGEDYSSASDSGRRNSKVGVTWRWRYLLGGILLLGAFLGLGAHGTFSPLVFGGLGALCFLWSPLSRSGHLPAMGYSPVHESTILRSQILPFEWLTVVEVKLSSPESARALSVLRDELVVVASPSEKASAYLTVRVAALSYRSANAKLSERLKRLAGILSRRGAYLLPLDSAEAARKFQPGLEPLKLDAERDGVQVAVSHSPYDVLVVKPDGVHVKKLGAYTAARSSREAEVEKVIAGSPEPPTGSEAAPTTRSASIPSAREAFEKQPLLWEVVSSLQERFQLFEPDGYVMFLNGMHLSRSAPPGAKLDLKEANGSTVTVESLGGTPVELTRPQLRTIVKVYG